MVLLGFLIVSAYVAYVGTNLGLYAMFERYLLLVLAVAAGIGFGGPLRSAIPAESPCLYGLCLLTIAVVAYLLLRSLARFCFGDPEISYPVFVDRAGGALLGFAIGYTILSYVALVVMSLRLDLPGRDWSRQLTAAAKWAVITADAVGHLAGTGSPITLDTVLPA